MRLADFRLLACSVLFHVFGISATDTITRDIAVIGGGSSGTYAAIRLLQQNKSVALIEKKPVLGGHVDTFHDPVTGQTFDYGVISFGNISVVNNYFAYFDIPLTPLTFTTAGPQFYANFQDGKIVSVPSSVPWTNTTASGLALAGYDAQLAKYPYLVNGFNLPSPVPEDLLITYGNFLQKYNLQALAYTAFTFIQGVGNILAQPTLYIMKYFNSATVGGLLGAGNFVTTARRNNHELYDKALARLGSSAFVSSNVTNISRSGNGTVKLTISTPSGTQLIKASKLLIAIPPKLENLQAIGLDLDQKETGLFSQFNNSYYWDMMIRNSGLPSNVAILNVDPAAPLALPALPGIFQFAATGLPGLHTAYYSSPYYVSDAQVKSDTLATLARIVAANNYTTNGTTPEFEGFNNHAPFELTVSRESIAGGFYGELEGLQGRRSTFWTGATWQAHDSSQIWNWTEYELLPRILGSW